MTELVPDNLTPSTIPNYSRRSIAYSYRAPMCDRCAELNHFPLLDWSCPEDRDCACACHNWKEAPDLATMLREDYERSVETLLDRFHECISGRSEDTE